MVNKAWLLLLLHLCASFALGSPPKSDYPHENDSFDAKASHFQKRYDSMQCVPFLLQGQLPTDKFMSQIFEKKVFFAWGPDSNVSGDVGSVTTEATKTKVEPQYPSLSVLSTKFLTFLSRSAGLRNSENVLIFQNGEQWSSETHPVTLLLLHEALSEGYQLIFKFLHRAHPAAYNWALCLQNELGVPVELDIWIYPSLASGMHPQAILDDLFLVQQSGALDVAVCDHQNIEFEDESNDRKVVEFTLQDMRNLRCDYHSLLSGDVLYIPQGHVYYATTPELPEPSITHVWRISRTVLSYGEILYHLVHVIPSTSGGEQPLPKELSQWFRKASMYLPAIAHVGDSVTIGNSVSNDDLPEGWMNSFKRRILGILDDLCSIPSAYYDVLAENSASDGKNETASSDNIERTIGPLLEQMKKLILLHPNVLEEVTNEFRLKLAAGMSAYYEDHFKDMITWHGTLTGDFDEEMLDDSTVLKLIRYTRSSLENSHGVFVINSEILRKPAEEELEGYKYCLGGYNPQYAHGEAFRLSSIPVHSSFRRREIVRLLLTVGALKRVEDSEKLAGSTREIFEASSGVGDRISELSYSTRDEF